MKRFPKWKQFKLGQKEPYNLSRSKIDLFIECPRCFYMDRTCGVPRPSIPGFTLNSAVDTLFKKEFDIHRANKEPHPLMKEYGIDAIPFEHPKLDEWRENFVGVQYLHEPTNLIISGAVDDLWINSKGELHVVDYKSTSKDEEINLDDKWKDGYKRQMAVYQWLLRKNGFTVSDVGYFVYANGRKDRKAFDGKLEFDVTIIPYEGDTSWIDDTIYRIKELIDKDELPENGETCEHCDIFYKRKEVEDSAPVKEGDNLRLI
jgi:hypothetical protein